MDTEEHHNYHNIFKGIKLGIGTWSWGDRLYWGFGKGYDENDLRDAFFASIENKVLFFDTAEVYGQGRSEKILGKFLQETEADVRVATKFMPLPWRLTRGSLLRALRNSLKRLSLKHVDLYQIHMPLPPIQIEVWMDAMVEAIQNNLIKAVGVSNFDRAQMIRANEALTKQGVKLASNQVEFSLINRDIEKNGLLETCRQLNVQCIAYSPIGLGLLSGKYSAENPMQGFRGSKFSKNDFQRVQPLIDTLKKIGADHGGKSAAQVAINWVKAKGALPIPGAKNLKQTEQNVDVLQWDLTEDEVSRLDEMSDRVL